MNTRKLQIACPECGSHEVFYSCTPNCCFNHVCDNCRTTFEPVTVLVGGTASTVLPPSPPPEPGDPTAACARCHSTAVYMTEEGSLICAGCRAILRLELTEVAPG
jgi:hypothetical protein